MPIYEYRCPRCDQVVEVMHGMNDDSKRPCETCGEILERLISRTSFALKGGGWYKDLYSSTKSSDKASSDSSPSSSSTSESKSSSTPDSSSSKSSGSSTSKSD